MNEINMSENEITQRCARVHRSRRCRNNEIKNQPNVPNLFFSRVTKFDSLIAFIGLIANWPNFHNCFVCRSTKNDRERKRKINRKRMKKKKVVIRSYAPISFHYTSNTFAYQVRQANQHRKHINTHQINCTPLYTLIDK